jgi:hypothetical protein
MVGMLQGFPEKIAPLTCRTIIGNKAYFYRTTLAGYRGFFKVPVFVASFARNPITAIKRARTKVLVSISPFR